MNSSKSEANHRQWHEENYSFSTTMQSFSFYILYSSIFELSICLVPYLQDFCFLIFFVYVVVFLLLGGWVQDEVLQWMSVSQGGEGLLGTDRRPHGDWDRRWFIVQVSIFLLTFAFMFAGLYIITKFALVYMLFTGELLRLCDEFVFS